MRGNRNRQKRLLSTPNLFLFLPFFYIFFPNTNINTREIHEFIFHFQPLINIISQLFNIQQLASTSKNIQTNICEMKK